MKKMQLLTILFVSMALVGVSRATFTEEITWDPNGNLGEFTDPTPNFATVLAHISAAADMTVSGGGTALITAVASAPSGTATDPFVIEVASGTYDGNIVLTDKTNIVIRAASGAFPIIDCSVLTPGISGLLLHATGDRTVSNIAIKGMTFKDIRRRGFGGDPVLPPLFNARRPASGAGIASFSGKILENIVIEDCVFDNFDATKDETFKGEAIHINEVDGLLIRRNIIKNGGAHGFASADENGAITIHEFDPLPASGGTQNDFLNNVFIQNNEIIFDYSLISGTVTAQTRGIVLGHILRTLEKFNNVVVEYNLVDNVQKEGIKVFGTSTDATDDETVNISNNVIKRTANGIEIDAGTVFIDRTIFDDQTLFGDEGKDVAINADGGTTTVTNTIAIEKTDGVDKSTSATVIITCIDLFNASLVHPTNNAGGTEFNVDPMFVGTSINDYTIGNASFPAGCAGGDFGLKLIPPSPPSPPTFAKDFSPNPIATGGTSTLTFTIDNSASTVDATSLAFTDNLPAGVVIETPNGATNTCGGVLTAVAASGTITLSGGSVPAGASCTIQVDITSATAGSHVNITGDLTSSSGNSGTASATLTANPPPLFSKSFSPNSIEVWAVSTLTLTIDNSASTVTATSLDFTDNLPAGVVVATPANPSNTCTGGTITAVPGSGVITYSGGTVAAGASCTIQVDVTSGNFGEFVNTTGDLTSSLGNSGTATATLTATVKPFVFLAEEEVEVEGNIVSEGDIHSNRKVSFGEGEGNPGVHTGNLSAVTDISIDEDNRIEGDAIAGDDLYLFDNSVITGTKAEDAAVDAKPLPAIAPFAVGTEKIVVPKFGTKALAPGDYAGIRINKKGTLQLTAGTYNIRFLHMKFRSTIEVDASAGAVVINILKKMKMNNEGMIKITGGTTAGFTINSRQDSKLESGKRSILQGNLIFPYAEVHFDRNSFFKGSVCAEQITVDKMTGFFSHSSSTLPKAAPVHDPNDPGAEADDYWIDEEWNDEEVAVAGAVAIPADYALGQNYPNPFNPSTRIEFALPQASEVTLSIYNTAGQLIRQLASGKFASGIHSVTWDGMNDNGKRVSSGVYLYRIEAGNASAGSEQGFVQMRKMILTK